MLEIVIQESGIIKLINYMVGKVGVILMHAVITATSTRVI